MSDQTHSFMYHKTEELTKILLKSRLSPSIQIASSTQVENQNQNGHTLSPLQTKLDHLPTSQENQNTPETQVEEGIEEEQYEYISEDGSISPLSLTFAQPRSQYD